MDDSTISTLIEIFNILSTSIFAFFAVFGIIVIFCKKTPVNIFRDKMFLSAFCAASFFAFIAETTFFNFQHYLKYFADKELQTTQVSQLNPAVILTSDSAFAEIFVEKKDGVTISSGLIFKNLDRRITSVFVKPNFKNTEYLRMFIEWTDEESVRGFAKNLYKGLPYENHTVIQPCGKVSQLKIMFAEKGLDKISQIAINKQIPFYFSGLRIFAVSLLFFVLILFVNKKLRAKTSYCLFEYKFNPTNKKQNLIYALSTVLLISFSWICVYTSLSKSQQKYPPYQQYNKFLVDAIIAKRTYLDYGNPEKLLNAERPYDAKWLIANGYKRDVDWMWDWAYYNGKHYCYFGVVPAVILYVPYKIITGNYLSNQTGIFLFSSVAIIFLAILWRFCVIKYMPNARFAFYLLSFFTLFFTSGLFACLRYPMFYCIVQTAGFMFAVAGTFLLLKSVDNEKTNYTRLFFACLCFALIVGCRPNLIFVSLLVPVVLWKRKSLKLLCFILIPYVIVAVPLCLYNYARFGSIFDFGANYNMTAGNMTAYSLLNPLGKITKTFIASAFYLFFPNKYSLYFPFVECFQQNNNITMAMGIFQIQQIGSGIINFPIALYLFYLAKKNSSKDKRETFHILLTFLIISAAIVFLNSYIVGFLGRYTIDIAIFIILPSLFCAYYTTDGQNCKTRLKILYTLLAISVFVGLFLFVTGTNQSLSYHSPVLYRYLEYSLGIIRSV